MRVVKLNNIGVMRKSSWCAINGIICGSFGRLTSIMNSNPRQYTILFGTNQNGKHACENFLEGDFDEISPSKNKKDTKVFEKVAFYIVPFWFVPIGLILRYQNQWWVKKSTSEIYSLSTNIAYKEYPLNKELVIVNKDECDKHQYSKLLVLQDNIYDSFEVARNNPF